MLRLPGGPKYRKEITSLLIVMHRCKHAPHCPIGTDRAFYLDQCSHLPCKQSNQEFYPTHRRPGEPGLILWKILTRAQRIILPTNLASNPLVAPTGGYTSPAVCKGAECRQTHCAAPSNTVRNTALVGASAVVLAEQGHDLVATRDDLTPMSAAVAQAKMPRMSHQTFPFTFKQHAINV